MENDYYYNFDGEDLTKTDEADFPLIDEYSADWNESLRQAGFTEKANFGGEFEQCEITIQHNDKRGIWLVEIMLDGTGFMTAICTKAPNVLKFIRDYGVPLLKINQADILHEFLERAQTVLFDPDRGLECAQRVGRREADERAYYRSQRKAKAS